jgi:hypothetical protein
MLRREFFCFQMSIPLLVHILKVLCYCILLLYYGGDQGEIPTEEVEKRFLG